MPTDSEIRRFAGAPLEYFGTSRRAMHNLPPRRLAELQLAAVQLRFGELRDRLPVLRALADEQRIHTIDRLDEAAALLLPHTVYKSYPASLLLEGRFDLLTTWLSRLTTVDLSGLDTSGCHSIDGWLELLDTATELRLAHSSGASGSMSFVPHTHADYDRLHEIMRLEIFPGPGQREEFIDFVHPHFRTFRGAAGRHADAVAARIAGSEDRVHPLHPGLASADVMFMAGRLRAAALRSERERMTVPRALRERREEFEEARRSVRAGLGAYVEELAERLRGRRVLSMSSFDLTYRLARAGLDRGIEGLFAPDSVYSWGGGCTDEEVPADWEVAARRFAGVGRLRHAYAMTEVASLNLLCEDGWYHMEPWTVVYVLHPRTGRPLPRAGLCTGRAAFFDLLAEDHWGGFVSDDEVTVDWAPCRCGRTSPRFAQSIGRYGAVPGVEGGAATCAASPGALSEALGLLNGELV